MNPKHPIPAPGYKLISGKRSPPASMGETLYVQFRNGICPEDPWPVKTTRWRWDWNEDGTCNEHPGDVVAIKSAQGVDGGAMRGYKGASATERRHGY